MNVRIAVDAERDFAALPRTIQRRVLAITEALAEYPQVSGVKALSGEWRGHLRKRTGDYRVVFTVDEADARITIVRIAHRREVYD